MRRLVCLLVLVAAPAVAEERRYAYRAELERPVRAAELVAGGVSWRCKDAVCTAKAGGASPSVKGCAALARSVGPVKRYAAEGKALGPRELQQCNAQAAEAATAKPAPRPAPPAFRATASELTYTGTAEGGER